MTPARSHPGFAAAATPLWGRRNVRGGLEGGKERERGGGREREQRERLPARSHPGFAAAPALLWGREQVRWGLEGERERERVYRPALIQALLLHQLPCGVARG
jgi:hypothetical protein